MIFQFINNSLNVNDQPGKNGEIQLTDSLNCIAKYEGLFAEKFRCKRYDTGDKLGFLMANIDFALRDEEMGKELKEELVRLVKDS